METSGRFSCLVAAAELIPGSTHRRDELVVLPHIPQTTFVLAALNSRYSTVGTCCPIPFTAQSQARNGFFPAAFPPQAGFCEL